MKRHAALPKDRWLEVQRRLDAIEAREQCRVLFAVESGSRARGFPSPDSDYDVRFVYARPAEWYLSLYAGRDVIETPIEDDMDVNGWDVRKALHLVLKSNAVISEWMESPIFYRRDPAALRRLRSFAKLSREEVALKRYFYALRPALALRFLRLHPGQRPPMQLQALMTSTELGETVTRTIDRLVETKRKTREMGSGQRIAVLDRLITTETAAAAKLIEGAPERSASDSAAADRLFRSLIRA